MRYGYRRGSWRGVCHILSFVLWRLMMRECTISPKYRYTLVEAILSCRLRNPFSSASTSPLSTRVYHEGGKRVHSHLGNGCCAVCSGLWMAGKMESVREAWKNGTLSWGRSRVCPPRSAYECGAYRIYGRGCTDNVEEWYTLRWQRIEYGNFEGMKTREEIGRESDKGRKI